MATMASTPSSITTSSSSLTRTPPPTSSSSAAQRRAEASTEPNSCYFPGCRKDTNCNCDICLASINATLDLIPHSSHSSLTKLSSSSSVRRRPLFGPEKTPPVKPKPISTPQSPPIQSTAKSRPIKERVVAEKATAIRTKVLVVLVVFSLFFIADQGVPKMVFWRGIEAKLKGDTLSKGLVGELGERIGLVQERIEEMINEKVVDCSSMKLGWQFHQEGQNFFHWKCVIYKSWVEEVSIWGSPLRSSGLLPASFSPRLLSVVSGKITEWSDGKVMSTIRTSNSSNSWTSKPWNKSVMQLEANTWVLEYKRSAWLEGQGLLEFAGEMVRLKNLKMLLAQQKSLFFSVHKQDSKERMIPT
ncbi:Sigma non-opioid intracellular receptor 1 domain-containing protein [Dioscorea alata]|uniref:Sigma non-opioid intracellular receptor 1 domain-containing protein n=1 Tax=Dioscorea alata TaxID=55571 RepID=A0ACB7UZP0_DIOAL|nr:Sigma non-opioid intracellular receptor 1 domain-containing protein [Dioscorea alata]